MTWNARRPTRHNRREWTAYERRREGVGFDHDGRSAMHAPAALVGLEDVEDLTLLSGLADDLESTASETDTV